MFGQSSCGSAAQCVGIVHERCAYGWVMRTWKAGKILTSIVASAQGVEISLPSCSESAPAEVQMPEDDGVSPVKPEDYVELRVTPAIKYSQGKIPVNAFLNFAFKMVVVSLTVVGTICTFVGMRNWLTVSVSFAGCCAAWTEFKDYARKSARHTWTVQALKDKLNWWQSLSSVERASVENISSMIKTCEQAILAETAAWMATPAAEITSSNSSNELRKNNVTESSPTVPSTE